MFQIVLREVQVVTSTDNSDYKVPAEDVIPS